MPDFPGTLKTPRLAAAPASPAVGQLYYNTGDNTLYWWNGVAWVGAQGLSGSTFEYIYSSDTSVPPGFGEIRSDVAGLQGNHVYVDQYTAEGENVREYLTAVKPHMRILVLAKADSSRGILLVEMTDVTPYAGHVDYFTVGRQVIGGGLVAGERVIVSFLPGEQVPTPLTNYEGKWLRALGGALVWAQPAIADVTGLQAALDAKQALSAKGQPNGYASLDAAGKVPLAQLATTELAYQQITATVPVNVTTEAGAALVVTAPAVVFDGNPVLVEFSCGRVDAPNSIGGNLNVGLFQDGTSLGFHGSVVNVAGQYLGLSLSFTRRLTPAAGSHTYSVRAWVNAGAGNVVAGPGGFGQFVPAFIRITRV